MQITEQSLDKDPQSLVRVLFCGEGLQQGPLWGLYFVENNLSEPVARGHAEMVVFRSGPSDSHRLLRVVEIDQETTKPLPNQPKFDVARENSTVIDLGLRRQQIEARKPPVEYRGVPSLADLLEQPSRPPLVIRTEYIQFDNLKPKVEPPPLELPPPPVPIISLQIPSPAEPALAAELMDEDPRLPPTEDLRSEVAVHLAEPPPQPKRDTAPIPTQEPAKPIAPVPARRKPGPKPKVQP